MMMQAEKCQEMLEKQAISCCTLPLSSSFLFLATSSLLVSLLPLLPLHVLFMFFPDVFLRPSPTVSLSLTGLSLFSLDVSPWLKGHMCRQLQTQTDLEKRAKGEGAGQVELHVLPPSFPSFRPPFPSAFIGYRHCSYCYWTVCLSVHSTLYAVSCLTFPASFSLYRLLFSNAAAVAAAATLCCYR